MLVEVKAKVARIIDGKIRKRVETFLVPDCDVFSSAEYIVLNALVNEQEEGTVDSSEILSLRQSPIKEVCDQFQGESAFIATLKDIFHEDGSTKYSCGLITLQRLTTMCSCWLMRVMTCRLRVSSR